MTSSSSVTVGAGFPQMALEAGSWPGDLASPQTVAAYSHLLVCATPDEALRDPHDRPTSDRARVPADPDTCANMSVEGRVD